MKKKVITNFNDELLNLDGWKRGGWDGYVIIQLLNCLFLCL